MIESSLLWTTEFATEEEDGVALVATPAPGMAGARKRRIGRGDAVPFVTINVVDVEVIVEVGNGAVVVLAAKQEELVGVGGRGEEGGGRAWFWWRIEHNLSHFEELLLLALVLCQDVLEVYILVVAALELGRLDFGLFLSLLFRLELLFGCLGLLAVALLFVLGHGESFEENCISGHLCRYTQCRHCRLKDGQATSLEEQPRD